MKMKILFRLLIPVLLIGMIGCEPQKEKAAYMITSGIVVDQEKMAEYIAVSVPLFKKAGAEEVAFGHQNANNIVLLEGEWELPGLVMIIKFPSMDAIHKFWNSPEYQAIKDFRDDGVVDPNFTIAIEDRN